VSYAGDITPEEAWKLLNDDPQAVLVDCRTDAEWRFVGVPDLSCLTRDVVYVEWNRVDGSRNESFVDDLFSAISPGRPPAVFRPVGAVLLSYRSGTVRSGRRRTEGNRATWTD
jgi:rhodanese-related sulfurtransferase